MTPPAKPRKTPKVSPTQRTLAECKGRGWTAQVVERWNPFAHVRVDLFGVIDLVVLTGPFFSEAPDLSSPGPLYVNFQTGILGIQATSGTNVAARMTKASAEPKLRTWLAAGGRFEVWGWSKKNDRVRGARKLWTLRRVSAELAGDAVAWHEEAP